MTYKMPEPVAHVHSNNDFCMDRPLGCVDEWPVYLFTADQLTAAYRQGVESKWLPIETAPKDGKTLLLGYYNSHGNWRTLRGRWFSQDTIDEEWEEPDMAGEGWYETPVEIDDIPNCFWTEPTHWQPMPPPPLGGADGGKGADHA